MELREKIAIKIHTSERMLAKIVYENSPINCGWEELPQGMRDLYLQEALSYIAIIEEAGYVKLADMDYRYLPTKECYCYDNGWRKIEV